MSDQVVKVGIEGNAKGLVTAAKDGDKALGELENTAKGTGKALVVLDKETKTLATTTKASDKALGGLEDTAKDTGEALGTLGKGAQESGRSMEGFERRTEAASRAATHLGKASQSIRTTGKVLAWGSDKIVNQYTALAGGAGIGLATKQAMDFNHAMTMTAIGARDAAGKIDGIDMSAWLLKTTAAVKTVSEETGAPMGEIAAGIDQIKSKTGNIHQATTEMEMLTKAAIGTGASVSDIFGLASQLDAKVGIKGTEQMRQALTLLMEQGQSGSFELKDMVDNGERLFTAMAQYNKIGSKDPMENLRSFGALLQMGKNAAGGPAEATTAMERMGAFMSNVKKVEKQLGKTGIRVKLDPRASIETNLKTIIVQASKTKRDLALRALKSSDAFGEEGGRLMDALANEYAVGRGFQQMDSFKTAGGDLAKSTSLMSAYEKASSDAYGQTMKLKSLIVSWSHDMVGGGALSPLVAGMRLLSEHAAATKMALTGIAGLLGAAVLTVGALKAKGLFEEARGLFSGKKGSGALGDLVSTSTLGVQRVFVVNLPGGMGGVGGAASSESGVILDQWGKPIRSSRGPATSGSTIPTSSRWGQIGRRMAPGAIMAATGIVASFADNGDTVRGWGGALGSAAGAALGFFGGPLGMMIGSQIGATAGPELAEYLANAYDKYASKERRIQQDGGYTANGTANRSRLSDLAPSDQTSHLQRFAAEANKTTASANGDFFKHISLNVETHVASDGTAKTSIWGENSDKIPVSTGVFKEASSRGLVDSLTPGWAPGRHP